MNKREIISTYKFPGCQKYWLVRTKDKFSNTDIFDISMGYSAFYVRGKTLKEVEDYLLDFIKRDIQKKIKRAERLVIQLGEFLEDERILTTENLLKKYKTKE